MVVQDGTAVDCEVYVWKEVILALIGPSKLRITHLYCLVWLCLSPIFLKWSYI